MLEWKKAKYSGEQIGLWTENLIKNLINDLNMKGLIFWKPIQNTEADNENCEE